MQKDHAAGKAADDTDFHGEDKGFNKCRFARMTRLDGAYPCQSASSVAKNVFLL